MPCNLHGRAVGFSGRRRSFPVNVRHPYLWLSWWTTRRVVHGSRYRCRDKKWWQKCVISSASPAHLSWSNVDWAYKAGAISFVVHVSTQYETRGPRSLSSSERNRNCGRCGVVLNRKKSSWIRPQRCLCLPRWCLLCLAWNTRIRENVLRMTWPHSLAFKWILILVPWFFLGLECYKLHTTTLSERHLPWFLPDGDFALSWIVFLELDHTTFLAFKNRHNIDTSTKIKMAPQRKKNTLPLIPPSSSKGILCRRLRGFHGTLKRTIFFGRGIRLVPFTTPKLEAFILLMSFKWRRPVSEEHSVVSMREKTALRYTLSLA